MIARSLDAGRESGAALAAGAGRWRVALIDGASASVGCASTYPLKLLVPRTRGPAAWACSSTYGGGLLSGDHVALAVEIDAGAAALIGTQANGKAYRSIDGGWSRLELHARVAEGALLAVLPDPMCCFADARFEQRQSLRLDADGSAVLLDAYLCGREARGERWSFDRLVTRSEVLVGGEPVAVDAVALDGRDAARRLGRFSCIASVIAVGPRAQAAAESLAAAVSATALARGAEVVAASGRLRGGVAVRVAACSTDLLMTFLRQALAPLFTTLGGDPWDRRP